MGNVTVAKAQPKRRVGRPSRAEIEAKTDGKRGRVGRPPGEAARIAEFKARLLAAPTGTKVIETVLRIALDDKHPGQMAALKMCLDRMLPMSQFEDQGEGQQRLEIHVTVSGNDEIERRKMPVKEANVVDVEARVVKKKPK